MHISIDGEYRFTVDADFWYSQGFFNGCSIDEKSLADLEYRVSERRAFNKALDFLTLRDHSRRELKMKLLRSFDELAAEAALQRIEELSLIDDERFAKNLAAELVRRKGMGKAAVMRELLKRGLDRETAEIAVDETPFNEYDRIRELLDTRFHSKLSDEKGQRQTFNALVRLGYSYSDIRNAMRDCSESDLEGEI